jgi:predicted ribosome quality control (RQC) complex YloA/Tae2 family protein
MPSISRGQVVNQDPRDQALEFAVQSAQKAAGLIQNRKQLDLMEEELRQTKWRDLHNSIMELMKNDALTNAAGWRGAFENTRGVLENLYASGGMNPQTIKAMFDRIEASDLDPQVMINWSFSNALSSDNLSRFTPLDIDRGFAEEMKKMAIEPPGGYPTMGQETVKEEAFTPRVPPTRSTDEMTKMLEDEKLRKAESESVLEKLRGDLEKVEPQRRGGRGVQNLQGKNLSEQNRIQEEIKREEEVLKAHQKTIEVLQSRMEGRAEVPKPPEKRVVVEITPRAMNEEERKNYRQALVDAGLSKEFAAQFEESGRSFSDAVDEWVRTGEVTPKQKGQVARYATTLKKALDTPKFASKLRQEYQTPDENGITKLQWVMINLGRMQQGMSGSLQDQYRAGMGMANAILNPSALQAMAAEIEANISKEKHNSMKGIKISTEMPDGSVQTLNLEEYALFITAWANLMNATRLSAGGGGGGGPLGDMTLDDLQKALREMERESGIAPNDPKYGEKQAGLILKNDQYKTYTKLYGEYLAHIFGGVDEMGNPVKAELFNQTYNLKSSGEVMKHPLIRGFFHLPAIQAPGMETPWGLESPTIERGGVEEQQFTQAQIEFYRAHPEQAPEGWKPPR